MDCIIFWLGCITNRLGCTTIRLSCQATNIHVCSLQGCMASIALCACCSVSFSQLTLFPACGDMCKDFVPDLNFRFSLGMSAILVSVRSGRGGMGVMSDSPVAVMCSLSLQEKFNVGSSSTLHFLNVVSGNQYLLLGGALVFGYLVRVDGQTYTHTHTQGTIQSLPSHSLSRSPSW